MDYTMQVKSRGNFNYGPVGLEPPWSSLFEIVANKVYAVPLTALENIIWILVPALITTDPETSPDVVPVISAGMEYVVA